jgi:cytochrome c oxidase subunit 4
MSEQDKHHIVSYKQNIFVWVALLILTVITVAVSTVDLKSLTVVTAITIATVKAVIVALYFMHLKFDRKILGIFLLITMFIFVAVLLLTFLDYGFRT